MNYLLYMTFTVLGKWAWVYCNGFNDQNRRSKCSQQGKSFIILWHFTRCGINSKGPVGLNFEWNHTQLEFKPETIEKMSQLPVPRQESTLRCCDAGAMLSPLIYRGS